MTKIKLVLTGAQGTGKTTLLNRLSIITELPTVSEVARRFNCNTKDLHEFKQIQFDMLSAQMTEENKYLAFLSDRSTIDNLAYYLNKAADIASPEETAKYISIALGNISKYTHIIYVKPEFDITKIPDDHFRDRDPILQARIDSIIKTLLHTYEIPFYTVTGSIDERIEQVLKVIGVK